MLTINKLHRVARVVRIKTTFYSTEKTLEKSVKETSKTDLVQNHDQLQVPVDFVVSKIMLILVFFNAKNL